MHLFGDKLDLLGLGADIVMESISLKTPPATTRAMWSQHYQRVGQVTYGAHFRVWHGGVKRWICYVLSLLKIHSPNCERCAARDICWVEVIKRLKELR